VLPAVPQSDIGNVLASVRPFLIVDVDGKTLMSISRGKQVKIGHTVCDKDVKVVRPIPNVTDYYYQIVISCDVSREKDPEQSRAINQYLIVVKFAFGKRSIE
jgi:pyrroline-5-carboxylate reductase